MQIGVITGSREGETRELLNKTLCYPMSDWEIQIPERKINPLFIADEAEFALSGQIKPNTDLLKKVLAPWIDANGIYSGAYGPRFLDQLAYVLETLQAHRESRQAIMSIWGNNPRKQLNVPCLTQLHFLIRNNELHCIVTMRSSDAWVGLPNDIGVYALMAQYVARSVGEGIFYGNMYINMHSAHIYAKDYEAARALTEQYRRQY